MSLPAPPPSWRSKPLLAIIAAVALVLGGLAIAASNEAAFRNETLQETRAQASILAASVTAALAFDDERATAEYLEALRANRQVQAAAVYDVSGALVSGYRRTPNQTLPNRPREPRSAFSGRSLEVSAPVIQGSSRLGAVYLRVDAEPLGRRVLRYASIGLLGVMASLVVAVLASAQDALRRTNQALTEANQSLTQQIAERERVEEALRQSQKMEAMGQLTGGVAHDFNNLLMVASGGLDLLDRTQDPARRDQLKGAIRQALDRGAALTRQLLAFARRSPLKAEPIDLAERVFGMRLMLDRSLREDIVVALQIAPDLWPVEVDAGQLEVAVLNVAVNARDAMPSGGQITVRARNRPQLDEGALNGDFVELSISDTGGGIPPEVLSRVFEPFFTTKAVGRGTGLGLSQVYGFMRASGGEARIESEPGRGATVRLLFPRALRGPVRAAAAPAPTSAPAGRRRVLLVEDDDAVAQAVAGLLEEIGCEVSREQTAADALKALELGLAVDLVLSDMVMPGDMDGITLALELRRRFPGLPVLLTTGFSEAAEAAVRAGLRLLAKPYALEDLARELAAALAEPRGR